MSMSVVLIRVLLNYFYFLCGIINSAETQRRVCAALG